MKEQIIEEQYNVIGKLIADRRLKEALTQLESFLWQCPQGDLYAQYEEVKTAYAYMLQYLQQGAVDPERHRLFGKLLAQTLDIADQTRLSFLDEVSPRYYHEQRRYYHQVGNPGVVAAQFAILEHFAEDWAISEFDSDARKEEVMRRHERAQRELFLCTWTNSAWNGSEADKAEAILTGGEVVVSDLCLFTSAVTLSLMECFDLRKLLWLLKAYRHDNAQVAQRALVGLMFAFHLHNKRMDLYPDIAQRIELLNEEVEFDEELTRVYRQFLLCQETEKITRKMQEEIIPEMLKNISRDLKLGLDENNDDDNKDDHNPDWSSLDDKFEKGVRQMGELQMEGADVYMSSFATLKSYPFFTEVNNWFLPFDQRHSSLYATLGKTGLSNNLFSLILQSTFFCNSDKYSIAFTLTRMPQMQHDMLLSQLSEQQMEELAEQTNSESLKKHGERPDVISGQYLHDLYRFFKLYNRHREFRDIFKERIDLFSVGTLKRVMPFVYSLKEIADFYLKKEHWAEAEELYRMLIPLHREPVSGKIEEYQKWGLTLQKLKRYPEAIAAYLEADMLRPDTLWTNRHLAVCYRLNREYDKALLYYQKVEEVNPDNASALFYVAHCLVQLNRFDEALQYFFKLDFTGTYSLRAWRGIAWCSFLANKYEQAVRYYDRIIADTPTVVDFLNAGHVAWVTGNLQQAQQMYSRAKELSTNQDVLVEMFYQDASVLASKGIDNKDIPLMLDLL